MNFKNIYDDITIENISVINRAIEYEHLLKQYSIDEKIISDILKYPIVMYLPDPNDLPMNQAYGVWNKKISKVVTVEYYEECIKNKREVLLVDTRDYKKSMIISGSQLDDYIRKSNIVSDIYAITIIDSVMHIYKRPGSNDISEEQMKMWIKLCNYNTDDTYVVTK